MCSASAPIEDTHVCHHHLASQSGISVDDLSVQSIGPIEISPVVETMSFLKFLIQNSTKEHVLHLTVLSHQCSSI